MAVRLRERQGISTQDIDKRSLFAGEVNLPIDLADACLVRMSELHADCMIWTTDAHFRIYRRHGRQTVPLLNP